MGTVLRRFPATRATDRRISILRTFRVARPHFREAAPMSNLIDEQIALLRDMLERMREDHLLHLGLSHRCSFGLAKTLSEQASPYGEVALTGCFWLTLYCEGAREWRP
jgi:hypothetical protein